MSDEHGGQHEQVFVTVVAGTLVAHLAQPDDAGVMRAVCPDARDLPLDLVKPPTATETWSPRLRWCGSCREYLDYLRGEIATRAAAAAKQNGHRRARWHRPISRRSQ